MKLLIMQFYNYNNNNKSTGPQYMYWKCRPYGLCLELLVNSNAGLSCFRVEAKNLITNLCLNRLRLFILISIKYSK
jgi:hypothetical protein